VKGYQNRDKTGNMDREREWWWWWWWWWW